MQKSIITFTLFTFANPTFASYTDGAYELFLSMIIMPIMFLFILFGIKVKKNNSFKYEKNKKSNDLQDETTFTPLSEFSKLKGISEEKLIEMIRDGYYNGKIINKEWYVHNSEFK